jgi:Tol biopolymer transport system component
MSDHQVRSTSRKWEVDSFRLVNCLVVVLLFGTLVRAGEPGLVFSLKTWEGDYTSKDVPGGVETTPAIGAIYSINADGTGLKKIIQPGKNADYPAASPDGKWVYYQSNFSGKTQIYRCKWDGTGAENLTPSDQLTKLLKSSGQFDVKDAYGYAFSADGGKMVFTVHDGKTGRVAIANLDGSSPEFINPSLGYIYMARLSPSNDQVVYSGPAKGYRLLLTTLNDGKTTELTPDHPESFVPQFTPDGKTVIFVRRDGDLYRVDTNGKNLKRLTEGNRYVEFKLSPKDNHGSTDGPDVSPDGKQIAFIALKDTVPNVFVVDIDGGNKRQVTSRKIPCGRVRWSPDGKQLSFVSFDGKYPQLFVVPASGGEPRQLTSLDGAVYFANWRPDR